MMMTMTMMNPVVHLESEDLYMSDRLKRKLENADRQDRLEQKLGISKLATKIRDERASKSIDRERQRRENKR